MAKYLLKPRLPVLNRNVSMTRALAFDIPFLEGSGNKIRNLGPASLSISFPGTSADPIWVTGALGKSLQWDGSNDSLSIADNSIFNFTTMFTLETLVYARSYASGSLARIYDRENGANSLAAFANNSGVSNGFTAFLDNTQYHSSANVFALNTLMHLVITFNSTLASNQIKYFANGAAAGVNTKNTALNVTTAPAYIGNRPDGLRPFDGTIFYIRMYKRDLSRSEILQLYANPWSIYKKPSIFSFAKSPSLIKTISQLSRSSVKTISGVSLAGTKKVSGVA